MDTQITNNLKIRIQKNQEYSAHLEKHIDRLEQKISYLKQDIQTGWVAAGCLLITLGIVLYQWLIVGVPACY